MNSSLFIAVYVISGLAWNTHKQNIVNWKTIKKTQYPQPQTDTFRGVGGGVSGGIVLNCTISFLLFCLLSLTVVNTISSYLTQLFIGLPTSLPGRHSFYWSRQVWNPTPAISPSTLFPVWLQLSILAKRWNTTWRVCDNSLREKDVKVCTLTLRGQEWNYRTFNKRAAAPPQQLWQWNYFKTTKG